MKNSHCQSMGIHSAHYSLSRGGRKFTITLNGRVNRLKHLLVTDAMEIKTNDE